MNKFDGPILITGAAGFIGQAIAKELLIRGETIIGIDNLNDYYDVNLKISRIEEIKKVVYKLNLNWKFYKVSIEDSSELKKIFELHKPKIVIHLAAQAGVRYSLKNPRSYIESNLIGFFNVIENCRLFKIKNFIYASSSSVYGGNRNLPYSEINEVNHPISLYAVTKKSNELIAHSYSHLYGLPSTGLRFFTVYGPWGRPDMAPMIFSNAILNDLPIDVFNYGKMIRDFTYIDDVVKVLCKCCYKPATIDEEFNPKIPNPSSSFAPYRLFNVGCNKPINLMKFIKLLEKHFDKKAKIKFKPLQDGDVIETSANTELLNDWIGFIPNTQIELGLKHFVDWYKKFTDYM